MVRAIVLAGVAFAVAAALWVARDAILIIYVSVLLAIGFSPLVHAIEHQRLVTVGTSRMPRWLAILSVYGFIVGVLTFVGLLVVPPLLDQARELWMRLPSLLDRAQTFLIEYGLLNHRVTLEEAVRSAPASPGDAVGTVATALTALVTGILAFVTVLILTFYLLIESESLFAGFARLFPRSERPRVEEVALKISGKISAHVIAAWR